MQGNDGEGAAAGEGAAPDDERRGRGGIGVPMGRPGRGGGSVEGGPQPPGDPGREPTIFFSTNRHAFRITDALSVHTAGTFPTPP